MTRVIIAEDDPLARSILLRMFEPDHQVAAFAAGDEAWRYFQEKGADLVLTDLRMPRMDGMQLLARIKQASPETIVFMLTGYSSVEDAVTAIKQGAYDYIAKPFNPDDVLNRISRALREKQLTDRISIHERQSAGGIAPVFASQAMAELLAMARRVARADSTVLLQGETGVGKEVVARLIHGWSSRAHQPFVPVNCGALAEGVLESELFGHERGAFTGAMAKRSGYFELSNRGTILLDEIGTTDRHFQVRLLRVLQERVITRVGGSTPIPVDTRVIAATNQDLEREVEEGRFRHDLYYRLSVVTLTIPPLRERREDIRPLAEHFVAKYRGINPAVAGITPAGLERLESYPFPGNVRELENVIERAMILETGSLLTPESLLVAPVAAGAKKGQVADPHALASCTIDEAERRHILEVLQQCAGRKVEAARRLGINKTTLWRKLKRFGVE